MAAVRPHTLLALGALLALLAAALLPFAPAAADGHPDDLELVLSVVDDSDGIVPPNSEISISAELRFGLPAEASGFTPYRLGVPASSVGASMLQTTGAMVWDSIDRRVLDIAEHNVINSQVPRAPGVETNRYLARAFDGRTLIMRGSRNNHTQAKIFIYDAHTLTLAHTLATPDGSGDIYGDGFGATAVGRPVPSAHDGGWAGSAIAVWHETDTRAWLFIGSSHDNVVVDGETVNQMGRLHIFQLDWTDDGVTVTPRGVLHPPKTESDNRPTGSSFGPKYAGAVTISRDGGTLAVSAHQMNHMGAIYVYTRPDGDGQDWGDIAYDDGVKVTVAAVPAWGDSATNRPFDPAAAGTCDSWCSRVWSVANTNGEAGADLGVQNVSLSADGRVLLAGASQKEYSSTTPGGGFTSRLNDRGDAFVWVAPEGGWRNAPRADQDAEGNAKTLIAAGVDASDFRQATHYSPGPLRRWTEPAVILSPEAWPSRGPSWTLFGSGTAISPDGTVAAVDDGRGFVRIFQRDSVDDWKTFNGGYLSTPSASLGSPLQSNIRDTPAAFSYDGSQLLVGDTGNDSQRGALRVYSRPANGVWASATPFVRVLEHAPAQNNLFGYIVPETSGPRVVLSSTFSGGTYLAHATAPGACTVSTVDGARTARCPVTLADPEIVIPLGTPDGPFTIFGTVVVRVGAGDPVTLRDELEVTVGTVDELAEVKFDFATNPTTGQPYSGLVPLDGSTTLLLQLLNEHGKASAKGAITGVLFTTNSGSMSARLGSAAAEACGAAGGTACRIANPETAVTASNADQIRLTITHPGAAKAGTTPLQALVVGDTGETFATEPITLTFSGTPSALAAAAPPTAVLGYAPTDSADQRNRATLVVSATDSNGNRASVPDSRYSAKLTDPDGKTVTSQQAELTWPLREGGADDGALLLNDGNPQARVTIRAAAASPLAAGEYALELSAGSGSGKLTATQTIVIAGGAAEVALSAEPAGEIEPGASITFTAVVTDASGALVPDGTPVRFSEQSTGATVALVLLSPARQLTRNGEAAVTLRAINSGGAYVTAAADNVSGVRAITVAAPPQQPPLESAIDALTIGGFNAWTDAQATTAAALYAALDGVSRISKWDGFIWQIYGEAGNRLFPGSVDFAVNLGDILWLSPE